MVIAKNKEASIRRTKTTMDYNSIIFSPFISGLSASAGPGAESTLPADDAAGGGFGQLCQNKKTNGFEASTSDGGCDHVHDVAVVQLHPTPVGCPTSSSSSSSSTKGSDKNYSSKNEAAAPPSWPPTPSKKSESGKKSGSAHQSQSSTPSNKYSSPKALSPKAKTDVLVQNKTPSHLPRSPRASVSSSTGVRGVSSLISRGGTTSSASVISNKNNSGGGGTNPNIKKRKLNLKWLTSYK